MKLYLSSYRLGDHATELKKLIKKEGARVAICVNALDARKNEIRNEKVLMRETKDIEGLGFYTEEIDLRNYFKQDGLFEKMKQFDAIWVSGGNTFVLAKAFKQSGFDKVLQQQVATGDLAYAGYSAAFCVLGPSLRGIELVDDKNVLPKGYDSGDIWDGFGLIDFYPIVHFRSNHHESDLVEKEYDYVCKNNIYHKTFKDGDVYIVDGENKQLLAE